MVSVNKSQTTTQSDRRVIAFNQGRRAHNSGFGINECQHKGSLEESWKAGWSHENSKKNKIN